MKINKASTSITCDCVEIEIQNVVIKYSVKNKKDFNEVGTFKNDEKNGIAVFTFTNQIPKDVEAILEINFVGTHNDKMAGFYRLIYI